MLEYWDIERGLLGGAANIQGIFFSDKPSALSAEVKSTGVQRLGGEVGGGGGWENEI